MKDERFENKMATFAPPNKNIALKNGTFFLSFIVIFMMSVWLGLIQIRMPEISPIDSPVEHFSAERAMNFLEQIAIEPRVPGTSSHEHIREYIVANLKDMDVYVEIQSAKGGIGAWGDYYDGEINNIIARIPGSASTGTVMITTHYDTIPGTPGAGDAGSSVAAILETIRALKASTPLINDVIFLFSDGEEIGLLGANAFVNLHPWAKDIDIVLNFEARGNSGPSVLFETSEQNERIIEGFIEATTNPITHSFMRDVYPYFHNDTDFSVYKRQGINGLNIAFFDGVYSYHTAFDTIENLNIKSVQHQGNNMLELVRFFGNTNLITSKGNNMVHFNAIGNIVVSYSEKLVIPLLGLTIVLYGFTLYHGVKKKQLKFSGLLNGFFTFLISLFIAYYSGQIVMNVVAYLVEAEIWQLSIFPNISNLLFISIGLIVFSILISLFLIIIKKYGSIDITLGMFFGWLILVIISSIYYKASSYIFVWPLILGLICINGIFLLRKKTTIQRQILSLIMMAPSLVLNIPIIYLLFVAVTLESIGILSLCLSLFVPFIIPALSYIKKKYAIILPVFSMTLGILLIFINYFSNV